eukprot:GHVR01012886.1.p1 GENE.GHVR01012886.1~~GHVR01012886.1.p1  ORF type:complete len:583 (-),score=103.71 GHVR01012886.1:695-2443(-)
MLSNCWPPPNLLISVFRRQNKVSRCLTNKLQCTVLGTNNNTTGSTVLGTNNNTTGSTGSLYITRSFVSSYINNLNRIDSYQYKPTSYHIYNGPIYTQRRNIIQKKLKVVVIRDVLSNSIKSIINIIISSTKICYNALKQFIDNPYLLYKDFKVGCSHMIKWVLTGSKLFGANVSVSKQLLLKKLRGSPLSLREHKLLVRTVTDCFKIIPFSFFIIVPFAEFLLPLVLRVFPNMLPSTFFETSYDSQYLSRKLKAKQELASFFHEIVQEKTRQIINRDSTMKDKAQAFQDFVKGMLAKDAKDKIPFLGVKETLQFARLFKEEFKIENMSYYSLNVMAKILGLTPFGIHAHLVLLIRHHVLRLQQEDREIKWEGVDSLTHEELIEACKKRAMTFSGVTDEYMRANMNIWLELSAHPDISPVLLLWSRCCTLNRILPIASTAGTQTSSSSSSTTVGGTTHTGGGVSDESTSTVPTTTEASLEHAEQRIVKLRQEEQEIKSELIRLKQLEKQAAAHSDNTITETNTTTDKKTTTEQIPIISESIIQTETLTTSSESEQFRENLEWTSSVETEIPESEEFQDSSRYV